MNVCIYALFLVPRGKGGRLGGGGVLIAAPPLIIVWRPAVNPQCNILTSTMGSSGGDFQLELKQLGREPASLPFGCRLFSIGITRTSYSYLHRETESVHIIYLCIINHVLSGFASW